jgi:hypothetical protein
MSWTTAGRLTFTALLTLAAVASRSDSAGPTGKRYALLVGVLEHESSNFSRLRFTENDVEVLGEVLTKAGYEEVVVLTTTRGKKNPALRPTAGNIRARLKQLSDKVTKDDLLLVGLSGHGLQWPVLDARTKKARDESFFCPCDARPRSQETLSELEKTMIPLGELFRKLDESGAGVRLCLVDACRNDPRGSARNVDVDELPKARKGTAILFSCQAGERAWESPKLGKGHGVFFYHVIQAMKSETKLTWSRLADQVIDKVTEEVPRLIGGGARQTPHEMRNIVGRSPLLAGKTAQPSTIIERRRTEQRPAPSTAELVRCCEKGFTEYKVFSRRFKIVKAEYDDKKRVLSWLLEARMAPGWLKFEVDYSTTSSGVVRFKDAEGVARARVALKDAIRFSTWEWEKGENVRAYLQLPTNLDLSKVKSVDIVPGQGAWFDNLQ